MRHAARVDANQAAIVSALRAAGASVYIIGLPVDLLVGHRGKTMLIEVKRDRKAKFTAFQREFMAGWDGVPVARVDGVDDALRALGLLGGANAV
jgi:hypothetical protein